LSFLGKQQKRIEANGLIGARGSTPADSAPAARRSLRAPICSNGGGGEEEEHATASKK
jgi:hypothetical protein